MGSFIAPPKPRMPEPAPPPPVTTTTGDAAAEERRRLEKDALRRRRGRAALVLTSGLGDTSQAAIQRPTLLGRTSS